MDGKIHRVYEVYCGGCGRHISHLGDRVDVTKAEAENDLRHNYQWKKIQGVWTCPDCQERLKQNT